MPTSGEAVRAQLEGVDLAVPQVSGTQFRQTQERKRRTADYMGYRQSIPAVEGQDVMQAGFFPEMGDLIPEGSVMGDWLASTFGLDLGVETEGFGMGEQRPVSAEIPRSEMDIKTGFAMPGLGTLSPLLLPLAAAGGGWLLGQLGLGDGGNGGAGNVIPGTNIPLGGPGLAEPPAGMVAKEWSTGTAQFYQLTDGRIAVYSKKKRRWKAYRPQKHIVVTKNPRMGTLVKAQARMDKLWNGISKRMPKKKTVKYGQLPAELLSKAEKKLIKA